MHTEIELKLLIDRADIPLLRRHPLLNTACKSRPKRRKLHNIYFDTPNFDLTGKAIALRLRRVKSRWIQTVKGGGSVQAGLHQRQEWEAQVTAGKLDFDKLADSPWQDLFTPDLRSRLVPLFDTDFWRTTWLLEVPGGVVELALDVGEIKANAKQAPICEVELELKSGDPEALFHVARILQEGIPLYPEDRSKADRGYALYRENAT